MNPVDFLLAFAQVTHQIATERDLERAEHAETKRLAKNLERDLRRTKALLAESESIRRGQAGELEVLRTVGPGGPLVKTVLEECADGLASDARALRTGQFTTEALAGLLEETAGRLRAAAERGDPAGRDRIEAIP